MVLLGPVAPGPVAPGPVAPSIPPPTSSNHFSLCSRTPTPPTFPCPGSLPNCGWCAARAPLTSILPEPKKPTTPTQQPPALERGTSAWCATSSTASPPTLQAVPATSSTATRRRARPSGLADTRFWIPHLCLFHSLAGPRPLLEATTRLLDRELGMPALPGGGQGIRMVFIVERNERCI
jgi:hypothetical protein